MEYFKEIKDYGVLNPYRVCQIYNVVQSLKPYAIAIYKNRYEDALDDAFQHILSKYDWSLGTDLEHYAITVVKNINVSSKRKEMESETTLQIALDEKSKVENFSNVEDIVFKEDDLTSTDLEDCMDYLTPMFIQDYKFFITQTSRSQSYDGLFKKFNYKTIREAIDRLISDWSENMEYLLSMRKKNCLRYFPEDRYLQDMDTTVEFHSIFKSVMIYKRVSGRNTKRFYSVNLEEFLQALIRTEILPYRHRKVRCMDVYCTLSGKIVCDDDLIPTLKNEIVGSIFARTQLKAVYYKDNCLIVSSSKQLEDGIDIGVFNIPATLLIGKCLN